MNIVIKHSLTLSLSACLMACGSQSYKIETLYQSPHCQHTEKGISVISDQQALNRILHSRSMLHSTISGEKTPGVSGPVLSKDKNTVVFSLGQKPSLGYRIDLAGTEVQAINNDLAIPLKLGEPEDGAIVGAAITTPCIVVAIDKGAYSTISTRMDITDATDAAVFSKKVVLERQ